MKPSLNSPEARAARARILAINEAVAKFQKDKGCSHREAFDYLSRIKPELLCAVNEAGRPLVACIGPVFSFST